MINIDLTINLGDIEYQKHFKQIIYLLESPILIKKQIIQDKSNISEKNSSENSISENKNMTELNNNIMENNYIRLTNNRKRYIKLTMTLEPNIFEGTKLLTIAAIDYYEVFKEEQIKNIVLSIFDNFEEVLINTVPLTANSESIIIDMNINVVFYFWATWKFADIEDIQHGFVSGLKANGDPRIVGTKLDYYYFHKYKIEAIIQEVNSYKQEGNEDDCNEWNYKYKVTFGNGQSETLNIVFVSCENGKKTWVSTENDINSKIGVEKLQELSKRKLQILNDIKNYIEKNKEFLVNLYNNNYNKK